MANYDDNLKLTVDLEPGNVKSTTDSLKKEFQNVFRAVDGKNVSDAFKRVLMGMRESSKQADTLYKKLGAIEQQYRTVGDVLSDLRSKKDKLERSLLSSTIQADSYTRHAGENVNSTDYATFKPLADEATKNMNQYAEELAKVNEELVRLQTNFKYTTEINSKGTTLGENAEYAELVTKLDEVNNELTRYTRLANAALKAHKAPSTNEWLSLRTVIENVGTNIKFVTNLTSSCVEHVAEELPNAIMAKMQQLVGLLRNGIAMSASAAANKLASLANAGKQAAVNIAKMQFTVPIKAMQKLLPLTKKVLINLTKLTSNTIRSGISKLASTFGKLGKNSNIVNNGLKIGFKQLLRYVIGVRSVFFLIKRLRKALIDGFGNLSQYSEPFNETLSKFVTMLETLKNQFAAAFAPIVQIVLPILNQFLGVINNLIAKFGELMYAMTGHKVYIKAKEVYKDYAESLDKNNKKTKDSTKKTKENTKAIEEQKRQLMGFDDVEILHEDHDDDSSKNGSTDTGSKDDITGKDMFKTLPISDFIKDLSKKIKEAWQKADFTEIGRMVGSKLLSALSNIPWDAIKAKLRQIATSIATFLNGFLSVPGLFYKIGETLAQAINSAFEFLNAFVHAFNWASLGNAIREGILGVLNTIDWPLIYDTMFNFGVGIGTALQNAFNNPEIWTAIFTSISYGLNSVIHAVSGFLQSVDWGSLGQNVGIGLSDGIEAFNWFGLGQDLVALINGVFDFWYNFVTTFDFRKFGEHIGTTLGEAVRDINWTTGAASVAETINGLFDAFNGFMENMRWRKLGEVVVNTIGAFFQNFSWSSFGEALHNIIAGIYQFLTGVVETIDWVSIPGYIVNAIKDFFTGYDYPGLLAILGEYLGKALIALIQIGGELDFKVRQLGQFIVDGFKNGILNGLTSIGSWIVTNIFNPFFTGFKKAFGIASPSKVMAELGGYLIEGLKMGLLSKITSFGTWLKTNVTDRILGFFEDHFQMHSPSKVMAQYGGYMMEGLEEGIEGNTGLATDAMSDVQNDMQKVFGTFSQWATTGSNLLTVGLVVGISAKSSLVLSTVDRLHNSMLQIFTNAVPSWNTMGVTLLSRLNDGMNSRQSALLNFITTTMTRITTTINNVAYSMSSAGQSLMSSLQSGMSAYSMSISSTASSIASSIYTSFSTQNWYSLGENIGMGIYNGLFNKQEWLKILAWNTAVAMYNDACEALDISSPSKKFAWIGEMMSEGMAQGVEKSQDSPVEAVVSMTNAVQEGAFENLQIPAVVKGEVIPYAATNSQNDVSSNTLNSLSDMLQYIQDVVVTRDDVYDILTELLPRYLNIVLQVGDEQIARHANAGNAKLNRRFNTVNKVLV